MRHASRHRKLGRTADERAALLRGLTVSLIKHGRITTTLARAKEIQPRIERLITAAKNDTVFARRLLAARLGHPNNSIVKRLFSEIAPKFKERSGGYTRVTKMGAPASGRREAVIAFVE
jgi:large subunit ribosomal protein L17